MNQLLTITLSLLSGGATVEAIRLTFPEIKQFLTKRKEARLTLSQSIDPILKAADELYGKLFSLSNEDFSVFTKSPSQAHQQKYVCYLFAQFWAQLEHIRVQSRYTSVSSVKKGEQLLRFISTCESKSLEYSIVPFNELLEKQ